MLFRAEIKRCKSCQHFEVRPTETPPYFSGFKFSCSHEKTCMDYNKYDKYIMSEQEKEKWRRFYAN
jgi:hypothetical protein